MFPPFRIWIWPVWLAIALALSIPLFLQEVDKTHPPAKLAGLIALVVAMGIWLWIRGKFLRVELWILGAALLVPALIREPRATLSIVAIAACALAFGRCACWWLKIPLKGRVEEIVASAALGFSAAIIILIALGAMHALYASVIAGCIVVSVIGCRRGFARLLRCAIEINDGWNEGDVLTGIQTFAVLVMIGCVHLVMLTPSIYYDAFATHLPAANYYGLHHALEPVPNMAYSGFPQGFELLMTAAWLLAGQAGAQMISPLFLILTLLAVYAFARALGAARQTAIAGAVFAIAIPSIQWSGAVVKNDLLLAFLLLFALLGAIRYWDTHSAGWMYAVAFAAAGAQNVKLSAMIAVGPLAILLFAAWWRSAKRIRILAIAAAIFIVCSSYWPVRNKIVFGRAWYPFDLYSVETPGVVENLNAGPATKIMSVVSLPWRLQFHGNWAFDGQNDTPLGFFFLLFLPACFWMRRGDWSPLVFGCLFWVGCYSLAWGFTVPIIRYAAAPIAMLAVGLSAGLGRTLRVWPGWIKLLLLTAVVYCHCYNWSVMASLGIKMPRIQFLAGKMDEAAFLRLTVPTYGSAAWIRDHAHSGEKTLSVGNYALAYMGDPGQVRAILSEQGPFPVSRIRSELGLGRYRYVLLPREVSAERVFEGQSPAPTLESADERYLVFRQE